MITAADGSPPVPQGFGEGVFSMERTMRIGAGTTAKASKSIAYFFVRELGEDLVEVRPLGPDNTPVGPGEKISKDKLLKNYMPEPSRYQTDVLPKLREAQKAVARGDKFRKRGESFTAEFEYGKALKIDDFNVRANFGIGLCYLQRGEAQKAHEVFERIVAMESAFEEEHKHLFNEFGINLRKQGMLDEAVEYYSRALGFARDDENLHYNIARANYDKGDNKKAVEHLKKCLELNPGHEETRKFIAFLKKKQLD